MLLPLSTRKFPAPTLSHIHTRIVVSAAVGIFWPKFNCSTSEHILPRDCTRWKLLFCAHTDSLASVVCCCWPYFDQNEKLACFKKWTEWLESFSWLSTAVQKNSCIFVCLVIGKGKRKKKLTFQNVNDINVNFLFFFFSRPPSSFPEINSAVREKYRDRSADIDRDLFLSSYIPTLCEFAERQAGTCDFRIYFCHPKTLTTTCQLAYSTILLATTTASTLLFANIRSLACFLRLPPLTSIVISFCTCIPGLDQEVTVFLPAEAKKEKFNFAQNSRKQRLLLLYMIDTLLFAVKKNLYPFFLHSFFSTVGASFSLSFSNFLLLSVPEPSCKGSYIKAT